MYNEYYTENRDKVIQNMMEISEERENLSEKRTLDKEKERELILRQFYQGLKLCTRGYNFY